MEIHICEEFKIQEDALRDIVMHKTGLESDAINEIIVRIYGNLRRYEGRFGRHLLLWLDRAPSLTYLFMKIQPLQNTINGRVAQNLGLFNREVELYGMVLPQILRPEDKEIVPECFYGKLSNVLVLDDMSLYHYRKVDKLIPLDYDHCIVALKTLARFHARSFIFEKETSDLIGKKYSLAEDCETNLRIKLQIQPFDSLMEKYYTSIAHSLADMFRFIPQFIPVHLQRFTEQFKRTAESFFRTVTSKDFAEFRVLCHSDLQASNLLFQYRNGKPAQCCLIDFQFAKFSSMTFDIWTFLFATTTKEVRENNIQHFINAYFKEFTRHLVKAGLDRANMLKSKEFSDMMRKDKIYGLLQAILIIYNDLHLDFQAAHGNDYRQLWIKLWMNSQELLIEPYDKVQRVKHRIVEQLLELYPLFMVGNEDSCSSDDPISLGDDLSDRELSPELAMEDGLRIRNEENDDNDMDIEEDEIEVDQVEAEEEERRRGQELVNIAFNNPNNQNNLNNQNNPNNQDNQNNQNN